MPPKRSEQEALNDPDFALEIALGPTASDLVTQNKEKGVKFQGKYYGETKKFLFKSAHLSKEDYRIYDVETGKLVMYSHHVGKDPFDSVDPLGMGHHQKTYNSSGLPAGEWEAHCDITGKSGFQSFKIRPKSVSRHGRQYLMTMKDDTFMNVCKQSKIKTMSIRGGFEVAAGDDSDVMYSSQVDLAERTMAFYNENDEQVMFMSKTSKSLIMNAALGAGSESLIEIAAGCDVSAMLAIIFGVKQVGASYVKDAFSNYVGDPMKDAAVDSAEDALVDNFGEVGRLGVKMLHKLSGTAVDAAKEFVKFQKMFYQ